MGNGYERQKKSMSSRNENSKANFDKITKSVVKV